MFCILVSLTTVGFKEIDIWFYLFFHLGTFPPSCPEGLFACSNGQCVRTDAKCNGVADCSDGSDEVDCKGAYINFKIIYT